MKKNLIFKVIILLLLIIMGVSFIVDAFMQGINYGFAAIGLMSLTYLVIITIVTTHD